MKFRTRTSIRTKLALLAGIPVVGALLLALFVASDARRRAASEASLGSIEDLARLTATMTELLHAVQDERAASAIAEGEEAADHGASPASVLRGFREDTDAATQRLTAFLAVRDRTKLPPRLSHGLADASAALERLAPLRSRLQDGSVPLADVLSCYRAASDRLVDATAALAEITDDADMLRNLSSVGALLEVEERASIEHAIVGYAAARGEFPPGAFKELVTTTTEESVYDRALRATASDDTRRRFDAARTAGRPARALLDSVLESTEDTVTLDASAWSRAESDAGGELREVERFLLGRIGSAAAGKASELRRAVRLSTGVSVGVLLFSVLLAGFVGRGVQRSIGALSAAADRVRASKDYSTRAARVSDDELGFLTETFNDMLAGIQARDGELEQHRSHLEGLVAARTRELGERNAAMRLVLDNVEQGLATIGVDGVVHPQRSAAFDRWFDHGSPSARPFHELVADRDENLRMMLAFAWEQVTAGFLPVEAAIEQLPKRFDRDGRHFTLTAKPILDAGELAGALLVVSDITAELEARQEQARQREEVRVFRKVARDKAAFSAFLEETGNMVTRLRSEQLGASEQLALVHTVKGNAAQYEVESVAAAAHELESAIVDTGAPLSQESMGRLFVAWEKLRGDLDSFSGTGGSMIELSRGELERLIARVEGAPSVHAVAQRLRMLYDEPVAVRFTRLGEHAERLAARLGKPVPAWTMQTDDLRLPRRKYAPFWASLVHLVRNSVDHGLESADRRAAAGKPAHGKLSFSASLRKGGDLVVEVGDDGAGIDWERVAQKARAAGLPAEGRDQIERAMFTAGVSTVDRVTDISGRGVGLAAVWDATVKLGGTVAVTSRRGQETRFVFRLPQPPLHTSSGQREGETVHDGQ
jgi:two-component system chemotaxis sensor kinase CheA